MPSHATVQPPSTSFSFQNVKQAARDVRRSRPGPPMRRICPPCFMHGAPLFTTQLPGSLTRSPQKRVRTTMVHHAEIHSLKNPRVKDARALLRRRQRVKENKILLEGQRLISDALSMGLHVYDFFYTKEAIERCDANRTLLSSILDGGGSEFLVSDAVIRSMSDTINPQGLVGIFDRPNPALPSEPRMTLICDSIRDPGNLGSLFRSAAAAGADAAVLTAGCTDVWGLKALRAGMGAQFRLPVRPNMTWPEIESYVRGANGVIHVADAGADLSYTDVDWSGPCALVVGSEADGPSPEAFEAGTGICVPMGGEVESLNAAMAGAVILFEAKRQRDLATCR